jgi:hypothetical protein
MARRMSPERESEFEKLAAFVDFYATRQMRIDPASPTHPSNSLRDIVEKFGRSQALEGLRQAANDVVESLDHASLEWTSRIDAELRAAGIMTVTELRHSYSRSFAKILKRGSIRSETEYYLVKGVADGSPLADEETRKLLDMLSAFEERQR